ncbi:DUF1806 family protein [Paenibacillus sp. M1]|uniref:DUF1806 family protein n=1 Tax=Paenibacillus haidiansis TaxID=1574488 RepID=A0ABU7VVB5_9BACL
MNVMMKIDKTQVEAELRKFVGEPAYVHSEATSYVFVRNFKVLPTEVHIAGEGDGPYRAALRFDGQGWLRMEALTHYEVDEAGRLLLAGFDDRGRMDVALHLGKEPFPE